MTSNALDPRSLNTKLTKDYNHCKEQYQYPFLSKGKGGRCNEAGNDTTRLDSTYQKVIRNRFLGRHASTILRRGLEHSVPPAWAWSLRAYAADGEGFLTANVTIGSCDCSLLAFFSQLQDGSYITAAIAVIGRAPYGHDTGVEHLLEAFHDELMGAADEAEVVAVVEMLDDIGAEQEACSSRRESPAIDFIRV